MINNIKTINLLSNQTAVSYIGQAGFILKHRDFCILIDPYLSYYVDEHCCTDDVIWVRNYPPPILAEELNFIDAVICTHAHYDHMDPDTISRIYEVNKKAKFITPYPAAKHLITIGIPKENIIPSFEGKSITLNGIRITPIPAAHETINLDASGNCQEQGYLMDFNGNVIYHSGDSCIYEGLPERIKGADVAILPINGRDEFRLSRNIIGNMNIQEAVDLAEKASIKVIIPMHFDLYGTNGADVSIFERTVQARTPKLSYHVFQLNETYIFSK